MQKAPQSAAVGAALHWCAQGFFLRLGALVVAMGGFHFACRWVSPVCVVDMRKAASWVPGSRVGVATMTMQGWQKMVSCRSENEVMQNYFFDPLGKMPPKTSFWQGKMSAF